MGENVDYTTQKARLVLEILETEFSFLGDINHLQWVLKNRKPLESPTTQHKKLYNEYAKAINDHYSFASKTLLELLDEKEQAYAVKLLQAIAELQNEDYKVSSGEGDKKFAGGRMDLKAAKQKFEEIFTDNNLEKKGKIIAKIDDKIKEFERKAAGNRDPIPGQTRDIINILSSEFIELLKNKNLSVDDLMKFSSKYFENKEFLAGGLKIFPLGAEYDHLPEDCRHVPCATVDNKVLKVNSAYPNSKMIQRMQKFGIFKRDEKDASYDKALNETMDILTNITLFANAKANMTHATINYAMDKAERQNTNNKKLIKKLDIEKLRNLTGSVDIETVMNLVGKFNIRIGRYARKCCVILAAVRDLEKQLEELEEYYSKLINSRSPQVEEEIDEIQNKYNAIEDMLIKLLTIENFDSDNTKQLHAKVNKIMQATGLSSHREVYLDVRRGKSINKITHVSDERWDKMVAGTTKAVAEANKISTSPKSIITHDTSRTFDPPRFTADKYDNGKGVLVTDKLAKSDGIVKTADLSRTTEGIPKVVFSDNWFDDYDPNDPTKDPAKAQLIDGMLKSFKNIPAGWVITIGNCAETPDVAKYLHKAAKKMGLEVEYDYNTRMAVKHPWIYLATSAMKRKNRTTSKPTDEVRQPLLPRNNSLG